MSEVKVGQRWRHAASGKEYVVESIDSHPTYPVNLSQGGASALDMDGMTLIADWPMKAARYAVGQQWKNPRTEQVIELLSGTEVKDGRTCWYVKDITWTARPAIWYPEANVARVYTQLVKTAPYTLAPKEPHAFLNRLTAGPTQQQVVEAAMHETITYDRDYKSAPSETARPNAVLAEIRRKIGLSRESGTSALCHVCRLGSACTHGPKVKVPFYPAVDEYDLLPDA